MTTGVIEYVRHVPPEMQHDYDTLKAYRKYVEYHAYLKSAEWVKLRNFMIKLTGGRCEAVGCYQYGNEPHHLFYGGDYDVPAGIAMFCRRDHQRAHTCPQCGHTLKGSVTKSIYKACVQTDGYGGLPEEYQKALGLCDECYIKWCKANAIPAINGYRKPTFTE